MSRARSSCCTSTFTPTSTGAAPRSALMLVGFLPHLGRDHRGRHRQCGPGNFAGFRKHVIEPSQVRILPTCTFRRASCFSRPRDGGRERGAATMNPIDAVAVANANRDVIIGIKVRVWGAARRATPASCRSYRLGGRQRGGHAAMCHIDHPRRVTRRCSGGCGRAMSYAFRPFPNSPATHQGTVKQEVLEARKRGVRFDIAARARSRSRRRAPCSPTASSPTRSRRTCTRF